MSVRHRSSIRPKRRNFKVREDKTDQLAFVCNGIYVHCDREYVTKKHKNEIFNRSFVIKLHEHCTINDRRIASAFFGRRPLTRPYVVTIFRHIARKERRKGR